MCGITGFFSYKRQVDARKYYKAHMKIAHRGPDDEGFIYKDKIGSIQYAKGADTINAYASLSNIQSIDSSLMILGHRRLSIIDLSADAHQPYSYENLSIVYNGEIYNYIELREELISLGYTFQSDSDTEVFLKAYHCWKEDALLRFNGMWAAAIYDQVSDTLFIVRDRFGIKPLYYTYQDGKFIFGSEIKFVASFFEHLYANEQMVYEYLRYNYIDHKEETLFQDIMQLEPNSYLKITKDGIKRGKYWDLKEQEAPTYQEVYQQFQQAISLRLRSDVEVGSLLSGGIDSSAILGVINKERYVDSFQTFSAVFDEEKFSEKYYIDKFKANNITLKKHYIYPKAESVLVNIEQLLYIQEEPFRSLAVFSQYEIYKYIKTHTKTTVLLNGQGADEIFTGYSEYFYTYFTQLFFSMKFFRLIDEFKAFKRARAIPYKHLFLTWGKMLLFSHFSKNDKYGIFAKDFKLKREKKRFRNRLKSTLWDSLTFSALREYLRYEDKNSMQFSLESRLPFLDFNLVEKAFALKDSDKIYQGTSKYVLREIIKGDIPQETLQRGDKMGFISPQELWQKDILKEEFDKSFHKISEEGIFDFIDKQGVKELYASYVEGKMDDWTIIWRLYLLFKWKEVWSIR
jgi:asparagine synthase (glutamine-hydrolysing)